MYVFNNHIFGFLFLKFQASNFYLYALYNKNKPKSDALMRDCGTAFFAVILLLLLPLLLISFSGRNDFSEKNDTEKIGLFGVRGVQYR